MHHELLVPVLNSNCLCRCIDHLRTEPCRGQNAGNAWIIRLETWPISGQARFSSDSTRLSADDGSFCLFARSHEGSAHCHCLIRADTSIGHVQPGFGEIAPQVRSRFGHSATAAHHNHVVYVILQSTTGRAGDTPKRFVTGSGKWTWLPAIPDFAHNVHSSLLPMY